MSKRMFRSSLLATTVIAGMAFAAPAYAQDAAAPAPETTAEAQDGDASEAGVAQPSTAVEQPAAEGQEIVVTGTLVRNPNLELSSPVNVTTSEEIELLQSNVAEEVLREIPGVVPSIGSAVNNGNGGASFVNLRGLGSNRNLVLLDGNRLVPAGLAGVFDLNNIPLALVERLDVLTGGASTTYGADAISGVVNFITKRDFAGLEVSASEQITERGDGNVFRVDATLGANFDDGRGNAVFSVGYQQADAIYQGERDISLDTLETYQGIALGSGTAVPSRFTGIRNVAGTANLSQGQIDPATGAIIPNYASFNFNPFNIFQTPFERYNIYGAANYEVSDAIEVYTRGLFSKQTVSTIIAPSGAFGIGVNISLNNPFLTDTIRNQFCAFDVNPSAAVYTPRFTQAECDAAATADVGDATYREIGTGGFVAFDLNADGVIDPGEGYNPNPQTALARRSVEAGPRTSDFTTTFFDYRAGIRGGITDTIDWDVSGAYGESENNQVIGGYFLNSRVRQSLLTTADGLCQNTANGCVPANFFGGAGDISAEAVDFLVEKSSSFVKTSLAQIRGTITGDFGWSSPWAREPIAFAVGAEYRNYQASQGSDALAQGGDLGGAGGATPVFEGGYNVREVLGELVVPLVQDRPFFESLTIEGGFRYSDYKVEAPGKPTYDTFTWKAGGTWEFVDGISLRGNYARAVRAPNIFELFSPVNTGLTNLGVDPCATFDTDGNVLDGRPAGGPTGELRAICLAQGATAGNVNAIPEPVSGQVLSTGGGSLTVGPETSDSYTIGVILQPTFLPRLTASIDYYNIKIKDAISAPTPADVIAACFGSDAFNPPAGASTSLACTSIRRDPITGGLSGDPNTSTGLPQTLSNSGSLSTDGIDFSVNYRHDITDNIGLSLSLAGNYTMSSKFNAFVFNPDSINRECTGYISTNCGSLAPEFTFSQRTTLSFDKVDVSLLWRHLSSMKQEPLSVEADGPFFDGTIPDSVLGVGGQTENFGTVPAYNYFDLAVRFEPTDVMTFTVTIQNLLDKDPPITGNNAGSTTFNSGNTFPSTYDALGRRYAVSAKLKF
jgi:iron complex outermembrane receptor protein